MLAEAKVRPAGARLSRLALVHRRGRACDKQASERVQLRFAELENLMPSDARFEELKEHCRF